MRIKRSRLRDLYLRKRIAQKDKEGATSEGWEKALRFAGECWPASGLAQIQQYGERLNYILNMKVDGSYAVRPKEHGVSYAFGDNLVFRERDGICVRVGKDSDPDYRIISIKPYRQQLKMELEKI